MIAQRDAHNNLLIIRNCRYLSNGGGETRGRRQQTSAKTFVVSNQTDRLGDEADVQHLIFDEIIPGNTGKNDTWGVKHGNHIHIVFITRFLIFPCLLYTSPSPRD